MKTSDFYEEVDGNLISLERLEADELRLVTRLKRFTKTHPDWTDYSNVAFNAVQEFYEARRLPRKRIGDTVPFQIAADLSARLGIAQGMIRPPSYLDELEDLVLNRFPSRRSFCKATGLSEDMLSHVLAGRKDFSLASLAKALDRIGYRLHITPAPRHRRTG